jgi:hypothetical protein
MQHTIRALLITVATGVAITACAEQTPLDPISEAAMAEHFVQGGDVETNRALATMRRVTARYHDIEAAFADGFVLLHPCEERPHHGPVGAVYIHFDRLMDGVIDPASPDALIYEPTANGRDRLVGVEFALPYALWNEPQPPEFLGQTFQPENEFGVWALHAWTWRHNPEGMFAESNPNVSCGAE